MSMHIMCCVLSELDVAGHADALEIPFLLSSDEIAKARALSTPYCVS
jgi:hypothetical protein